jgi:hypothetical protein
MMGDVYQLPFDDGSFDAVFANGLLLHTQTASIGARSCSGDRGGVGRSSSCLTAS